MEMWTGYHYDKDISVIITVDYDEDNDEYEVEVVRGLVREVKTFVPKHAPEEDKMHISDLEKSVKLANVILKSLKQKARRKK
jgi:hypothetical protein